MLYTMTQLDDTARAELCAHRDAAEFSLAGKSLFGLVVAVHDLDTIKIVVSLDGAFHKFILRVEGVDSPEMTDPDPVVKKWACEARNRMLMMLAPGAGFDLHGVYTRKDIEKKLRKANPAPIVYITLGEFDKYGRILADIRLTPESEIVQKQLIKEGYCKPYGVDGNLTKDPWTASDCNGALANKATCAVELTPIDQ